MWFLWILAPKWRVKERKNRWKIDEKLCRKYHRKQYGKNIKNIEKLQCIHRDFAYKTCVFLTFSKNHVFCKHIKMYINFTSILGAKIDIFEFFSCFFFMAVQISIFHDFHDFYLILAPFWAPLGIIFLTFFDQNFNRKKTSENIKHIS